MHRGLSGDVHYTDSPSGHCTSCCPTAREIRTSSQTPAAGAGSWWATTRVVVLAAKRKRGGAVVQTCSLALSSVALPASVCLARVKASFRKRSGSIQNFTTKLEAAARAPPPARGGGGALAKEKRPELYSSGRWTTKHERLDRKGHTQTTLVTRDHVESTNDIESPHFSRW